MIQLFSTKDLLAVENAMKRVEPLNMIRHSRMAGVSVRISVSTDPPEVWHADAIATLRIDAGHIVSLQHFDRFDDLFQRIKEERL